jgi:hypothetical protein
MNEFIQIYMNDSDLSEWRQKCLNEGQAHLHEGRMGLNEGQIHLNEGGRANLNEHSEPGKFNSYQT